MLDVVPELMGDHVCLREVTGRSEATIELVEESEVEVDFLVERTVEWAHRGLRGAAARCRAVPEEHEVRGPELSPGIVESAAPCFLRVIEDERHELHHRLFAGG